MVCLNKKKKTQQIKKVNQCNAIDLITSTFLFFSNTISIGKNDLGEKELKNLAVVPQKKNTVK